MQVDKKLLQKISKALSNSDFDIAAGLREDEFNNFFVAHYKQQMAAGGGVYVAKDVPLPDLQLKYSYSVDAAITAELAPLTARDFGKIMSAWVASVPELLRFGHAPSTLPATAIGTITDPPPPNVRLRAPKITLTLTADDGSINPPATLSFSMRITGFISARTAGNQVTITIVPVDARIDDPAAFKKSLDDVIKRLGFRQQAPFSGDCVPLEQLIKHIINVVLASKIGSFVKEFSLPVPIHLFNNVALVSVGLDVVEKLVVVLAKVGITASVDRTSADIMKIPTNPTKADIEAARARIARDADISGVEKATIKEVSAAADYPNRGLFLLLHQRFFQIMANTFLIVSSGQQGGGGVGPIFYNYGWSMRTWNPIATIIGNTLEIDVDCEGRAWAQAGIHTHCGDISAGVSATADALPAKTNTIFYFENNSRELWMALGATPFTVSWSIGGLPWPLNDAIAALLDLFTDLGVVFIAAWGLRWKHKLTTLPDYFPGTQLKYDLSLDQQIVADQGSGALMAAGSVNFKS